MRAIVITILLSAVVLVEACSQKSTNQPSSTSSPATSSPATASSGSTASSPTPMATTTPASTVSGPKAKLDACTLLTSDEIKAVQGEPIQSTKPSDRSSSDFIMTQCYYELATASNSISLMLTAINPD